MAVWVVSLSATNLITRSPTPDLWSNGIRSLIGFGSLTAPSPFSALPPLLNDQG